MQMDCVMCHKYEKIAYYPKIEQVTYPRPHPCVIPRATRPISVQNLKTLVLAVRKTF